MQEEIIREAQTMRQQAHPNVLPLYCSFVHQHNLWMVMPYVSGGSVLNIMKYAYPEVRACGELAGPDGQALRAWRLCVEIQELTIFTSASRLG